jgi:hypothetical protein
MSLSERKSIRFIPSKKRYAILKNEQRHMAKCRIQDISCAGVCFEILSGKIDNDNKKDLQILFNINSKHPIEYTAKILREPEDEKWLALHFIKELSYQDLMKICGNNELAYGMAKMDKASVLKEALQIKTCSSNYFIWTVGLMIPLVGVIWTLFMQDQISPRSCSGAMLGMFLLFCMSIFSSLEKSRAIYKREGFVAALDSYLVHGLSPPNYQGWVNLKYSYAECASKREADVCPRKLKGDSEKICKFIGMEKAKINSYKRVIPSILDSFISLTSTFYAIIFIIISVLSAISIIKMFSVQDYSINSNLIIELLSIGFFIGFFIFGRNTNLLILAILSIIIILTIDAAKPNIAFSISFYKIEGVFIKILIFSIAYIFGVVGNNIISQLIRLRTREYSLESQFYMWRHMFEHCIHIPNYEINKIEKTNKFNQFLDSVINFLFFRKLYNRNRI